MGIFAENLRLADFSWLIQHSGWQQLPTPPGEDVQGLDVRHWIKKDGVVLSDYPIPRGERTGMFGTVALQPPPPWAQATGLECKTTVEDLVADMRLKVGPQGIFRLIDEHLVDVKAYLSSNCFARCVLSRHIAFVHSQYEMDRSTLRELRPTIGRMEMIRGLLLSSLSERLLLRRYRRALKSLEDEVSA